PILRSRDMPCEVAASAQRFGKQIRYAERRGIPYVWFPESGEDGHQVKDIRTGEQYPADPHAWTPPATDLRPRIKEEHVIRTHDAGSLRSGDVGTQDTP